MSLPPRISVVMSVFNGVIHLRQTVESILGQSLGDFEFIVVNDGSTDGSRDILAELERQDRRIRVIDQENRGLTLALIRGCREAQGEYIARQDAGDYSLPGRFEQQLAFLESHPEVVLESCWTQYIGPADEDLFLVQRAESAEEVTAKLRTNDSRKLQGIPHHGSAFFRRADYQRAGGYRPEFYWAQDLDLWMRLTDFGLAAIVPQLLYCARIEPNSISAKHRQSQVALSRIIVQLRKRRERGADQSSLLARAQAIRPGKNCKTLPTGAGYYFIGRLLQKQANPRASEYLQCAIDANPWHVKARTSKAVEDFIHWVLPRRFQGRDLPIARVRTAQQNGGITAAVPDTRDEVKGPWVPGRTLKPRVSVVMSVYNGQERLRESVESILAQTFGDFEFIIVNDGSTDGSRDILAEYQRQDRRIRVIDQENRGLTRALIRGCKEATGYYVARQDADDESLPGRILQQVQFLERHPEITLLSCGTRFVGPEGEELFTLVRGDSPQQATERMRADRCKELKGINGHGSALFRRADYERVGGYREQFYYAQDLDLWSRLTDFGMVAFLPEVLYVVRVAPHSIRARHYRRQVA